MEWCEGLLKWPPDDLLLRSNHRYKLLAWPNKHVSQLENVILVSYTIFTVTGIISDSEYYRSTLVGNPLVSRAQIQHVTSSKWINFGIIMTIPTSMWVLVNTISIFIIFCLFGVLTNPWKIGGIFTILDL